MKKWTKVLSAFVVATVMGVGVASAAGCDGCDDKGEHVHTYATVWSSDKDGHWHDSTCGHEPEAKQNHVDADENGKCDVCDYEMGTQTPPVDEKKISTVEQLLAFRQLGEITEGDYTLEADIDLNGVTLAAPNVVLSGTATFNGNGHTIMNGSYANADSKTGLLFKSIKGASVSDIRFLNCGVTSSNESAGMLAGTVESGNKDDAANTKAVISKIEFNSCNIKSTGNYGGLLYGRNEYAASIEISEITAKNGTSVTCAQYGGFLTGDNIKTTALTMKNLDLDGEFSSSSNGSFLAGRTRGSTVVIENVVLKATLNGKAGDTGLFVGGSDKSSLTVKNVLIKSTNATSLCKLGSEPTTLVTEKIYSVGEAVTLAQSKPNNDPTLVKDPIVTEVAENSVATLKDTLGFDFENVWQTEGDSGYRLKAASTNIKSEGATLTSIKVNASNAKLRYKKDVDEFSSAGLLVMGVYSDGVQLVLSETAGYTVDASGVHFDTAGKYKVTVKAVEDGTKVGEYEIEVVEQTGIKVYQDRMSHVYLVGAKSLDTANMSVKSVWSDGLEETLAANAYTVTDYNLERVGVYTAKVKQGQFDAVDVKITVVNDVPVAVDGKVYVNVDKSLDSDVKIVKGVANFKTVTDAIKYLEFSNLSEDVTKVVYIGAGTFEEHIKTGLKNLTLIGKGSDKTVITASNVQSTVDPLTDTAFGLKENATVIALGEGFQARGLAIRNDFDYPANGKKESGPQGTALMIGGDKSVISDCLLYGHQDTLYFANGRTYVKDSEIQGNIDFIFGEATGLAYFDNCTIKAINKATAANPEKNNGYVTAMKADENNKPDYGYIFSKCKFTDDGTLLAGSMSLGRPWGAKATVAYLECDFSAAYSTLAYGATGEDGKAVKPRWYDMSGNLPENADFAEWKSTGAGAITEAVKGGKILTDEQAANYTKTNIFAKTNGKCTWTAAWNCDNALTALIAMDTATVDADNSGFAVEFGGDVEFGENDDIVIEVKKSAHIDISVGPWNSNDKELTVEVADPTIAKVERGVLTGLKAGETKIVVTKDGFETYEIKVTVTAPASTEQTITTTIDYSLIIGTVANDTEQALNDNFAVTGKVKVESSKIENAKYEEDNLTFDKHISLTSGAVAVKNNSIKFTLDKEAKIVVYAAQKADKTTKLNVLDNAGNAVSVTGIIVDGETKSEFTQLPIDKVSKYEFKLGAGTYYLGGANGGAYIFKLDIVVTVQAEKPEQITKTLDYSALDSTGVAADTECALDDFFTATGNVKKENAKIEGAKYEADGLTFENQISLTKGKVSTTNNGIKFTVEKEAKIVIYAAQKSDKSTNLSIIDAEGKGAVISGLTIDGTAATAFDVLPKDKVSKYEFTLSAGTYNIGGAGGGAYIYGLTVTF